MVQGYYTLEEAARILGMPADQLNQMAQHREVRAFADRGTWRFRTQDIEELARRRGVGSNPDLPLADAPAPKSHDSPAPRPKETGSEQVFHRALPGAGDQVEIGQEIVSESPGSRRKSTGRSSVKNIGPKSAGPKSGGPKSPSSKPGSDSDVRLVSDGSDLGFKIQSDSDVRVGSEGPKSKAGSKPPSSRKPGPKQDSGVRLVPMDIESDSDVRIVADSSDDITILGGRPSKAGSDSDIRLEPSSASGIGMGRPPSSPDDSFLTEEIDLDAELQKAQETARPRKPQPKPKSRTPQPKPPTAPFELSEADIKPKTPRTPSPKDSSSEFELAIDDSGSSIELEAADLGSSSKDEEVSLGDMPAGVTGASDSGINLQEPADSGISLEQGGDSSEEIEFELSLDAESTPKPAKAAPSVDSSSEFELTLEDSGRLAPMEEEGSATGEQKDIFETDFEVPALEEESGSEAMALDESDTDLESSDFDLALAEEDAASEEESGSQVVALEDEGEVDEGAATIARPRHTTKGLAEEEEGELPAEEEELAAAGEPFTATRRVAVAAAPADWGVFAPVTLMLSVVVMLVLGLMSFELLHGMWGYRQPSKVSSPLVRGIGSMFYDAKDFPTD